MGQWIDAPQLRKQDQAVGVLALVIIPVRPKLLDQGSRRVLLLQRSYGRIHYTGEPVWVYAGEQAHQALAAHILGGSGDPNPLLAGRVVFDLAATPVENEPHQVGSMFHPLCCAFITLALECYDSMGKQRQ